MRTLLKAVALLVLLVLSGCDNPITCRDPCPNRAETRDFFCGCFDPKENERKRVNNGGGGPTTPSIPTAQCVCQYSNGTIGAWFNYPPGSYQSFGRQTVAASSCSDLTVCERTETNTGGYSYTFLTGKISIEADSWNRRDNLVTGGSVWYLLGHSPRRVTDFQVPNLTPMPSRFAGAVSRVRRMLVQDAAFTNDVKGCTAACDSKSPFCLSQDLNGLEASGLRNLKGALSANPEGLKASDLQRMFGLADDPCGRGDTALKDGLLVNEGDACTIEASIPSIQVTASLAVPTSLAGQYRNDGNGSIAVDLTDPETRPKLRFSDKFLDADWGGDVKHVFADRSSIGFAVGDQSCVRLNFN